AKMKASCRKIRSIGACSSSSMPQISRMQICRYGWNRRKGLIARVDRQPRVEQPGGMPNQEAPRHRFQVRQVARPYRADIPENLVSAMLGIPCEILDELEYIVG